MNIQKKDRKFQPEIVYKDRGDMIRKQRKEIQTTAPHDRGDVKLKRNKKTKELFKTTKPEKAESLKISLVTRSTNTFSGSVPLSFGNRSKHADDSSDKCVDFRKRIKDKYTFKLRQKVERKDGDISKFNYVMQYDVKNELPKASYSDFSEKQRPKEYHDVKRLEKAKDKTQVHRAVSAMKLKPTKPAEVLAKPNKDIDEEKNRNCIRKNKHRKPVIKTITSKMDTVRVFKAVTFVANKQRKPLQVKIPSKDPKPKPKSKIPVSIVSKTLPSTKRGLPRRFVKSERIHSPSSKSADSLPTEVAQWVPESINQHTKPYYEAWVNKTATASTKYSKEEMKSVKSTVLRSLEMRKSPELVYQRLAEEYAGKIRVRRKGK